jgi:hypothetical protein
MKKLLASAAIIISIGSANVASAQAGTATLPEPATTWWEVNGDHCIQSPTISPNPAAAYESLQRQGYKPFIEDHYTGATIVLIKDEQGNKKWRAVFWRSKVDCEEKQLALLARTHAKEQEMLNRYRYTQQPQAQQQQPSVSCNLGGIGRSLWAILSNNPRTAEEQAKDTARDQNCN